jgi:hypothetical protein
MENPGNGSRIITGEEGKRGRGEEGKSFAISHISHLSFKSQPQIFANTHRSKPWLEKMT